MGVKTGFLGFFKVGALMFGSPGTGNAVLYTNNGTPTDGTSGTLAGKAGPGSIIVDTTNCQFYMNTNTLASPTWTLQGGAGGDAREVRNETGSTIAAGKLVYISGWNETVKLPLISLADADAGAALAQFVVLASIATAANGLAAQRLRLTGQATNGRTVGDPAYLDTTAGGYTFTAPTGADDAVQVVGRVAVVHASTGIVEFDIRDVAKIGTNELEDKAVTLAKMADVATDTFVGRDTAGTGVPEAMSAAAAAAILAAASLVAGVAGGYKIARGQHTTVDEDDTVVTGLATVVAAIAVLESDPVAGAQFVTCVIGNQAGAPAAGSIQIKTWKATAAGDTALIAGSTFSKLVNWIAIGT